MAKAIVGACWGDEGKGKICDMFAENADVVVRFQGGSNAGHTIINKYGKFALHQIPSGVFNQNTVNVIGPGVALDIKKLGGEIASIVERNVPAPRILISDRVQVVMPYHVLFDEYEEERLGKHAFGSTKSGIAPFYADKYSKIGFEICELFDEKGFREKLTRVLEIKNTLLRALYNKPPLDFEGLYEEMMAQREIVKPYMGSTFDFFSEAVKKKKTILLEGQLGALKDPDHGIYPFVTSSSPLAAFAAIGAGLPPYEINEILAVVKAYSSAVGEGAFVSEIFGAEAELMRKNGGDGGEYGATTGRPRRMGWFDAVASRYGCKIQGATEAVLTVLDALGYLKEIKICTGYEIDGKVTDKFPVTPLLSRAKPVYETLKGWECDIRGIRDFDKLPENARAYVNFIEKAIDTPITMVSNGPGRDEIIFRK